jgi:hypothetical protein
MSVIFVMEYLEGGELLKYVEGINIQNGKRREV